VRARETQHRRIWLGRLHALDQRWIVEGEVGAAARAKLQDDATRAARCLAPQPRERLATWPTGSKPVEKAREPGIVHLWDMRPACIRLCRSHSLHPVIASHRKSSQVIASHRPSGARCPSDGTMPQPARLRQQ
jgi:hypothetical protein